MNREALDEFFAKAEDVLTDWRPSGDAMVARVEDEGAELVAADSYYEQPRSVDGWDLFAAWSRDFAQLMNAALDRALFGEAFVQVAPQGIVHIPVTHVLPSRGGYTPSFTIQDETTGWEPIGYTPEDAPPVLDPELWARANRDYPVRPETVQQQALRLRRERNTGPADRRGLDGRFRRRGLSGE